MAAVVVYTRFDLVEEELDLVLGVARAFFEDVVFLLEALDVGSGLRVGGY